MAQPHAGSWNVFGYQLPDFGVTERVSDFFGQGRTSQGGSNLGGNQSKTTQAPSGKNSKGQTTFVPLGSPGAYGVQGGYRPTSSIAPSSRAVAGAATGPSGYVPSATGQILGAQSFDQDAAASNLQSEVDSVYGDAYNNLNQQEAQIRAGEQDLYSQFTAPYDAQRPLLDQAKAEGLSFNQQQQDASKQQEANALSAARKLYQELTQGVQQRFGGANSAGEFANAFFGREFQRNVGNVQQEAGKNMQKLIDQSKSIQDNHQAQLMQLEQQKQGAIAQARNVFNEKLAAINNARFGLDQNKAQLKLQALQELRANVQNVLASAQAYEQQVRANLAQAQAQLAAGVQAYRAQAGQQVDLNALPQAYYTAFGGQQANPTAYLNQVYGIRRREDERS